MGAFRGGDNVSVPILPDLFDFQLRLAHQFVNGAAGIGINIGFKVIAFSVELEIFQRSLAPLGRVGANIYPSDRIGQGRRNFAHTVHIFLAFIIVFRLVGKATLLGRLLSAETGKLGICDMTPSIFTRALQLALQFHLDSAPHPLKGLRLKLLLKGNGCIRLQNVDNIRVLKDVVGFCRSIGTRFVCDLGCVISRVGHALNRVVDVFIAQPVIARQGFARCVLVGIPFIFIQNVWGGCVRPVLFIVPLHGRQVIKAARCVFRVAVQIETGIGAGSIFFAVVLILPFLIKGKVRLIHQRIDQRAAVINLIFYSLSAMNAYVEHRRFILTVHICFRRDGLFDISILKGSSIRVKGRQIAYIYLPFSISQIGGVIRWIVTRHINKLADSDPPALQFHGGRHPVCDIGPRLLMISRVTPLLIDFKVCFQCVADGAIPKHLRDVLCYIAFNSLLFNGIFYQYPVFVILG